MDLPFFPQSQFYKQKFGFKVQKIPLTIASTCPNRMGLKGMTTCVFCDEWGSSAYPEQRELSLTEQIDAKLQMLAVKRRAENFLAYFQTYTSTFLGVQKMRESFDMVLANPAVKGIIIGTRPDCLSKGVFELINEYQLKTYVSVELGVQSFENHQLEFLRRGHTGEQSIKAVRLLNEFTTADVGIHMIFGLPNETDAEIIRAAELISKEKISSVKIHNLHVLKNTPLAEMHARGEFVPDTLEEYSRKVILFLQHLSPEICVERLVALSSHWEELIAPEWNKHKLKTRNFIIAQMVAANAVQGQWNSFPRKK